MGGLQGLCGGDPGRGADGAVAGAEGCGFSPAGCTCGKLEPEDVVVGGLR